MESVVFQASDLAGRNWPEDIPEWPEWMFWRDTHAVYSETQLFRIGYIQALCRFETALYMIRHQAPNNILMEEYRAKKQGSWPLFRSDHANPPWTKRLLQTWPKPPDFTQTQFPPQEILMIVPALIMKDAFSEPLG